MQSPSTVYARIGERFLRLVNLFNESDEKPFDYGTGILLTRAEIHTVEAVGNHEGLSVTSLSAVMGISKSAASQIITRLKAKGLVVQTFVPGSDRDTALGLTDLGQVAYVAHQEFHDQFFRELAAGLNSLDPQTVRQMIELFDTAETLMKKRSGVSIP